MQILKKEMREEIVSVAREEILEYGYQNASLRNIAKKAHTTLGNLYNYFESKEAILSEVIGDMPERLDQLLLELVPESIIKEMMKEKDIQKVEALMEKNIPQIKNSHLFLQKETIILLEGCEGTKYAYYREHFYDLCNKNLITYFKDKDKKQEIQIYMRAFEAAFIYIGKTLGDSPHGIKQVRSYLKLFLMGMLYREGNSKISIKMRNN
ncbi:transcriptional regulator, TetR family [Lachnospiraceae bacterium KM106-2]|nr:transcriptional regulator, TetR family [Lachnospiraceae bacterium KM106-2]